MELVVGRVAKSHGIRGELAVEIRTDEPELRFAVGAVLHGRKPRDRKLTDYTVEAAREHSGRLLLRLKGVDDRTAADALRGTLFIVDTAELPPSDNPDEFYDHELEGLEVRLGDGTVVGTVVEVLHSAAGELLSVRPAGGENRVESSAPPTGVESSAQPTGVESSAQPTGEILIPFVTAIVPVVSVADGYVEIDPPEGLLDPE